jgi:hypothetical protein
MPTPNPLQGYPEASSPAADDWLYLQGATNNIRKLSPDFYAQNTPDWNALFQAYPSQIPIRGFLNNFANYGSGQQDAIVYTSGIETFFQGTLKKTSGSISQGIAMYDIPNGFDPVSVQRPASCLIDVVGGAITIHAAIAFNPFTFADPSQAQLYYASTPAALAFIENSGHIKGSSYLSGVMQNVIGSDNVSLWVPKPWPSLLKVCVYFHGSGDDYLSHATSPHDATSTQLLFYETLKALLDDGWLVLTSDGGALTNHWGNDDSWVATQAAISWVKSLATISKIVCLGQSMGGLPALRATAQYPGITRFYGIYPVTNLGYMHSSSSFTAEINTAFGGNFAGNSPGCDPMLFTLSQYAGKSFKMTASASDTVVSKTNNSDAFATLVTGTAADVTVTTVGGNHGSPLAFLPADIVAFLNL